MVRFFTQSFLARSLLAIALAGATTGPVLAADPCAGFKWDVTHEHTLFGGPPTTLAAGSDVATAPTIAVDRLYDLKRSHVYTKVKPGFRSRNPDRSDAHLFVCCSFWNGNDL